MAMKRYGPYSIEVSNPEKVFFPDCGITKADIVDYYARVADTMLPHVRGRIVTMHRFPDGITGKRFYQKDVPDHFPPWIKRVEVKKEGGKLVQLVIENAATLVYLASQACVTPHVWLSLAVRRDCPDRLIFDLDPSNDDFAPVRDAARGLREMLLQVELKPYLMTTGSRGLHLVVPLDQSASFDEVRNFAQHIARELAARNSKYFTVEQRKAKRRGRVFLDTLRNAYGQHGVSPYAIRAKPGAPVATPVAWKELADIDPQKYTIKNIFRRLSQKGDPWKGIGRHASSIAVAAPRR